MGGRNCFPDPNPTRLLPDPTGTARGQMVVRGLDDWMQVAFDQALYGDGESGSVTLDGTNNYSAFSSRSGFTYTLIRDLNATNLTIDSGVTLNTAGYVVHCSGQLTNRGTIQNNGSNAAGTTAGAGGAAGRLGGGFIGGTGLSAAGNGNAGAPGSNNLTAWNRLTAVASTNGAGGAGGDGAGGNTGGAGGTVSAPAASAGRLNPVARESGQLVGTAGFVQLRGGSGGGSGGGVLNSASGGGGGGGGLVFVCARIFDNASPGVLKALGGNGANGTVGTGTGGGGGGGGGGGAILVTCDILVSEGTLTVTGGTHGNGAGTGTNGSDGSDGFSWVLSLVSGA